MTHPVLYYPPSSGWVKHFTDGVEIGSDEHVRLGLASWRKGRQDNMIGVECHWRGKAISIFGATQYWQEDILEARFMVNEGILVARKIYGKIDKNTDVLRISSDGYGSLYIGMGTNAHGEPYQNFYPVKPEWKDKWLSVTMDKDNTIWEIEKPSWDNIWTNLQAQ